MTTNAFRMTPDGSLDRRYLRTCAVWRLLKAGRVNREQAYALADLPVRGVHRSPGWLKNTIDIWLAGPLKEIHTC